MDLSQSCCTGRLSLGTQQRWGCCACIQEHLSEWVIHRDLSSLPAVEELTKCKVRSVLSSPNTWKTAFYSKTSMGGSSSARPLQRPSGNKYMNPNNLTWRNFSNSVLEVSLEGLPSPAVGSQSCCYSLVGSLPSSDPLEPALCVRC